MLRKVTMAIVGAMSVIGMTAASTAVSGSTQAGATTKYVSASTTTNASPTSGTQGVITRPATQRPSYPTSATLKPQGSGLSHSLALSPAGCVVHVGYAHISTYYLDNFGETWIKANGTVKCNYPVTKIVLRVQVWKAGFFVTYLEATSPNTRYSVNRLKNTGAARECTTSASSTYYGEAYAEVTEGGVVYTATVQSASDQTWNCGTPS